MDMLQASGEPEPFNKDEMSGMGSPSEILGGRRRRRRGSRKTKTRRSRRVQRKSRNARKSRKSRRS